MARKYLSLIEARRRRDEGLAQVNSDQNLDFKLAAVDALERLARRKEEFIVDDIWTEMGADIPSCSDNRAMGLVTQFGLATGLIEATTFFQSSAQPQCHANPRRVWSSLVFEG